MKLLFAFVAHNIALFFPHKQTFFVSIFFFVRLQYISSTLKVRGSILVVDHSFLFLKACSIDFCFLKLKLDVLCVFPNSKFAFL